MGDLVPHHLLSLDADAFPAAARKHANVLRGRTMLARRTEPVPVECVARGYLSGSGWKEYRQTGSVCGITLPPGLDRASRLPEPIFTPATKAEHGHDENVDFATVERALGPDLAARLRDLTLALYERGAARAAERDLILADTKFEFGHALDTDELLLIDEVLTPDSSRYWDVASWNPGTEPASFDKQYVRNWLDETGWDKESPPPELPPDVVQGTLDRYVEAFRRITGREPEL